KSGTEHLAWRFPPACSILPALGSDRQQIATTECRQSHATSETREPRSVPRKAAASSPRARLWCRGRSFEPRRLGGRSVADAFKDGGLFVGQADLAADGRQGLPSLAFRSRS